MAKLQAKDILDRARYVLSDIEQNRWTDKRLLVLLNDGILDIAKRTTLFIDNTYYTVLNNVVDIDLSSVSMKILRAEYLDEVLPLKSFDQMDKKDREWQLDTGDKVKALVFDKQRNGVLKQYPIVNNAQNPHITYNDIYGIITDISYSDYTPNLTGTLGDLAGIPDEAIIKFYYVRKHARLDDVEDELDIDPLVEQPLTHYITGMALRDNQDAQNRQMASEELQLYLDMLEIYDIENELNFVRADYEVPYRPNGV